VSLFFLLSIYSYFGRSKHLFSTFYFGLSFIAPNDQIMVRLLYAPHISHARTRFFAHIVYACKFWFHGHGDNFSKGNDLGLKGKSQFAREKKTTTEKRKRLGYVREHRCGNDSSCYYNEIITKINSPFTSHTFSFSHFCYNSFLFFHFHQPFQFAANVVDLVGCATPVHFCNFHSHPLTLSSFSFSSSKTQKDKQKDANIKISFFFFFFFSVGCKIEERRRDREKCV